MNTIETPLDMDENAILSVSKNSPAFHAGLQKGDIIVSVNGHSIADALDWEFFASCEDILRIELMRGDKRIFAQMHIDKADTGIDIAPMKVRHCRNRCIFCFIDQLPRGLRHTLYTKDGDFRFSFLEGSYITMTNLSDNDRRRIIEQRISPLYISIHSTDEHVRRKLLGNNKIPPIVGELEWLVSNSISFHTQIVVVPGINDRDILAKTVTDILAFHPHLLSIAVVPVGLTQHRAGLSQIDSVSPKNARRIVNWHHSLRNSHKLAGKILQIADEFFLLANEKIPCADYYGEYPQYENGVGMLRYFLDGVVQWRKTDFPNMHGKRIIVATGALFAPVFRNTAQEKIARFTGAHVECITVTNRLFGESITVANLLAAKDILDAVKNCDKKNSILLLPPSITNRNRIFLDDWTIDELERAMGMPIFQSPDDASELGSFLCDVVKSIN